MPAVGGQFLPAAAMRTPLTVARIRAGAVTCPQAVESIRLAAGQILSSSNVTGEATQHDGGLGAIPNPAC